MHVSEEVKGRIAGAIFLSIVSISITCIIFILTVLFVTDLSGVQEHIGECIIASAIVTLGWFYQFG
ncbi:MAG: hypothetical protein JKY50_18830 [Oleispira sp.]|nr:hypothetical protein [Oleispira sp.]MBL4881535.1 hypothetical protein [Oleispira sp.]